MCKVKSSYANDNENCGACKNKVGLPTRQRLTIGNKSLPTPVHITKAVLHKLSVRRMHEE